MSAYDGAVENQVFHVRLIGKLLQHVCPDPGVAPASKPFVDAVPFTVLAWQQTPLRTTAINPEHRFQEASAVSFVPDVDARMYSQERAYFGPLFVWYSYRCHPAIISQMSTEPSQAPANCQALEFLDALSFDHVERIR